MTKKYLFGAFAFAGLLLVAACDQKEEKAAADETVVSESVADETSADLDADEIQAEFERSEAGCRAVADALAIWTARPWIEAEDTLTRGAIATIRVIRPGDNVTMDYRTDRLNVELDENDIVSRVYCG
ncbi:MAG: I78 family peptidase inhibitor [Parvibaculum sp.]|uniref:I78 family peptidase inhibitor n=1 Tax=Parvibaculum sp. TaxID=2024848 RepID=UPI002722C0C2|nr:I78 family peptidase inhibitor [Parvibaculum sp.]MDO8839175.1 I78 family peptidase inhibitor [Parvibaculum sp.]